jgi:hypothetical protein
MKTSSESLNIFDGVYGITVKRYGLIVKIQSSFSTFYK